MGPGLEREMVCNSTTARSKGSGVERCGSSHSTSLESVIILISELDMRFKQDNMYKA